MTDVIERPQVRHVYQNHHLDGPRWERFKTRPGDIVISTSYKAGTTLMQTIVSNLLFPDGNLPAPANDLAPWLDMRLRPFEDMAAELEAQTHRRCMKTHLPLDGLPYREEVKYVVVSRDPRDVFMSLVNHYSHYSPETLHGLNSGDDRVGDPFPPYGGDPHELWRNWITRGWFPWESDGYPYWSHLHHAKTWWEFRHLPNIRLVHYNDLRADLEGQMRALAAWLDIEVPEADWPAVVHACQFETVKADPSKVLGPMFDIMFVGGAQTFIHKGTNGRWKDLLSEEELAMYEAAMRATLPADCARWLEQGGPCA
jgi:aryl sulfotransferase